MLVMIVFVVSLLTFRLLGRLGVGSFDSWKQALRFGFAIMFLFTAAAHFGPMRYDLARMVPPVFPFPETIVTLTGLLEVSGAIGLMTGRWSRVAAMSLALLLVAMFPANVWAALQESTLGGKPVTPLPARTVMQLVWIAGLTWIGLPDRQGRKISSEIEADITV